MEETKSRENAQTSTLPESENKASSDTRSEKNASSPETDDLTEKRKSAELHEDNGNSKKKNNGSRGVFGEILIYVLIIVLCVTLVPRYVVQRTKVDGRSMMNTLHNNESLLVEKVTYYFKDPERFDIITFYPYGRDREEYYIKRVIGLPGETVQIQGDTIYIDGEELEEDYGREPMETGGIAEEPIKLKSDEFFVLGDNRNESLDSRSKEVGVVKRENIDGHAVLKIYPFSEFGVIRK